MRNSDKQPTRIMADGDMRMTGPYLICMRLLGAALLAAAPALASAADAPADPPAASPFHMGPVFTDFAPVAAVDPDLPIPPHTAFKVLFNAHDGASAGQINRVLESAPGASSTCMSRRACRWRTFILPWWCTARRHGTWCVTTSIARATAAPPMPRPGRSPNCSATMSTSICAPDRGRTRHQQGPVAARREAFAFGDDRDGAAAAGWLYAQPVTSDLSPRLIAPRRMSMPRCGRRRSTISSGSRRRARICASS